MSAAVTYKYHQHQRFILNVTGQLCSAKMTAQSPWRLLRVVAEAFNVRQYEDLKVQIDQETELAEELENQIRNEKESHEGVRKEYDDRVGKDIEALKTYIKDLEEKLSRV